MLDVMTDAMLSETVRIKGHNGDEIEAYSVRVLDSAPRGGVVVLHHMPGYDDRTKEIARWFGHLGYNAIMPNLYWRDAPGASPDDAAAAGRANGGVPSERLIGDVSGSIDYLKGLDNSNGKTGTIGYCSAGRQSVLAACHLPLDAAVDCYGAFVVGQVPDGFPLQVSPLYEDLPNLGAPLLGLFGAEDQYPSPEQVTELDGLLTEYGKVHEFHSYEGAGHAFFAADRPSYRPESVKDGWARIEAWFGKYLSSAA